MIHCCEPGMEGRFDVEEICDKSGEGINGSVKLQFHPVGMAVHPVTAMCLRDIRKLMRGFEVEGLNDFHEPVFMEYRGVYGSEG